jgi:2-C-methyl-D-erythritol 2,4-cyclodiphosphate synthase
MDHIHGMELNISNTLNIPMERVNVKAKTNEGMGFLGRGEGIAAFAVATVIEKDGR